MIKGPTPFDDLREFLRADGADIVIRSVNGEEAVVELLIGHEACTTECIVPKSALERVLLPAVASRYPEVARIVVIDPARVIPPDGSSPQLTGAFDLHVHAAPDVVARKMDDLQLVAAAAEAGMRGFLLKSHHGSTVERAYLLNGIEPRTWIAGGLTLNDEVGGLNPAAVEAALKLGGRCIWMPTQSSANHKRKKAKAEPGLSVFGEDGNLLPAVHEILALIGASNVLLATGHLETREVRALARAAIDAGVERILISHVELDEIAMPAEVQLELADLGCYIEHSLICIHPIGGAIDFSEIVANIRVVGPERCVITTDYGQPEQPEPPTGLANFITMLREHGFDADEIAQMSSATPRELVGSA